MLVKKFGTKQRNQAFFTFTSLFFVYKRFFHHFTFSAWIFPSFCFLFLLYHHVFSRQAICIRNWAREILTKTGNGSAATVNSNLSCIQFFKSFRKKVFWEKKSMKKTEEPPMRTEKTLLKQEVVLMPINSCKFSSFNLFIELLFLFYDANLFMIIYIYNNKTSNWDVLIICGTKVNGRIHFCAYGGHSGMRIIPLGPRETRRNKAKKGNVLGSTPYAV